MSRRSAFRDLLEERVFAAAHAGLSRLAPERAEAAGRRLGGIYRNLDSRRRSLARTNVSRAFPERSAAEVEAIVDGVFAHFGGVAADLAAALDEPLDRLLARVEVENEDAARRAVATGRGVFFLASHLGNWEVAAVAAATRGLPMSVIARPLDNPRLEARLRGFRERTGNTVVPKAQAAREILRAVRAGGTVGILLDQHARGPDALAVPFFGRPASTSSALARLVDRTEALVLPAAALRVGPARYRLAFEEPIDVRSLSSAGREPLALTALLNSALESQIRRAPEQWLWLHNRWRLD